MNETLNRPLPPIILLQLFYPSQAPLISYLKQVQGTKNRLGSTRQLLLHPASRDVTSSEIFVYSDENISVRSPSSQGSISQASARQWCAFPARVCDLQLWCVWWQQSYQQYIITGIYSNKHLTHRSHEEKMLEKCLFDDA